MTDLQAIALLFGVVFAYIIGMVVTQYIVQAYNVYKVYLMFWGERMKMGSSTIKDAWDCMNYKSPYSQADNLVIIVICWPLALLYITFVAPLRLIDAVWSRYVIAWYTQFKRKEYRLLPSWVSWSKLTEILNRTI